MKSGGISSFDLLQIIPCCHLSKLPPVVARMYSRTQDTDAPHAVLLDRQVWPRAKSLMLLLTASDFASIAATRAAKRIADDFLSANLEGVATYASNQP